MTLNEIMQKLKNYNQCETERSWTMSEMLTYENDYIKVKRIDSSNRWIIKDEGMNKSKDNTRREMGKMWSIIVEKKKDFENLRGYRELSRNGVVETTLVQRGRMQGKYGIRIRNMKREPSSQIIKDVLNFIFEN